MRDRGLVRLAPLTTVFAAVLLAAVALTPRLASADCGSPQCTPAPDGSGCCNQDCTWMSIGAACRDEVETCHNGTCADAGGGARSCTETVPTNTTGTNALPCIVEENVCLIGECHSGNCSGIGSAGSDEYKNRCPSDGNVCTDDCYAPGNVFVSCTPTAVPNGLTCYVESGTNCTRGLCQAGVCDTGTNNPINCGTPPECERNTCNPATGCGTEPDPGTSCDTTPTDCTNSVCSTRGNCKNLSQPAGTLCGPGDGNVCTIDKCNATKQCNVAVPAPNNPPTDCTNPSTNSCQYDQCFNGACTIFADVTKNGQTCQTDTNSCTTQACNNGSCAQSGCASGAACAVCGSAGHCLPPENGCGCMPN